MLQDSAIFTIFTHTASLLFLEEGVDYYFHVQSVQSQETMQIPSEKAAVIKHLPNQTCGATCCEDPM